MYVFAGLISLQVYLLRREVHCLRASLSEQDLDSVGGLSPRASIHQNSVLIMGKIYLYQACGARSQADSNLSVSYSQLGETSSGKE